MTHTADMITLYTAPGCGPCLVTKRALDRAGLVYRQIDLSQDAEAMERVKSLGYRQAPVVVVEIEGQEVRHWSGFRPDLVAELAPQKVFPNS